MGKIISINNGLIVVPKSSICTLGLILKRLSVNMERMKLLQTNERSATVDECIIIKLNDITEFRKDIRNCFVFFFQFEVLAAALKVVNELVALLIGKSRHFFNGVANHGEE